MEELKRAHELRVDESWSGQLIENQNTSSELMAKAQELQDEINCMIDSREFTDAEQCAVDKFLTFPGNLRYFVFQLSQEDC